MIPRRVQIAVFININYFAKQNAALPMEGGMEAVKERKLSRLARVETTVCALTIL